MIFSQNIDKYDLIEKPSDWPCNNREANLERIYNIMEAFIANPNYKNRELLFSILNPTDENEIDESGSIALRSYEVAIINYLFQIGAVTCCQSLKMYLYSHISRYTFICRLGTYDNDRYCCIKEYEFLHPSLRIFYLAYQNFDLMKNRSFVDCIIDIVKLQYQMVGKQDKERICNSFNEIFFDLGFDNSNHLFSHFCFNRDELKKLFELSAELNNSCKHNISQRPYLGIMKMTIRQWILKSRSNYNSDLIYKSISTNDALTAHSNYQVWMSKTTKLNDRREQKVIRSIFANKRWIKYNWAKKVSLGELSDSFVCSFSNVLPSSQNMKKRYGTVILGYKTDRIADLLSPVYLNNGFPRFEQVFWYDIIYDEQEAKYELNYLCDIIDFFDLTDAEKGSFFNDILEYWYLSFKDKKKWECEKERRYQTFVFEYKDYKEIVIDQDYLKIKSSLYLCPDFALNCKGNLRLKLLSLRKSKTTALMTKDYYFCENCLQANRALYGKKEDYSCPICGSKKIYFHKGKS